MLLSDFDYHLPPELIAQAPLADRAGARMLVVDRSRGTFADTSFSTFPTLISALDCLIMNDSRVIPSRLFGEHEKGGRAEIFLIKPFKNADFTWSALVRPGRKVREGDRIRISPDLVVSIVSCGEFGERVVQLEASGDLYDVLERVGHVPLPPYIHRPDTAEDRERYQTVYARARGSVAAPTAGLHFDPPLISAIAGRGVEMAYVTLHVGAGTFQPVKTEDIAQHQMHAERYEVPEATQRAIAECKARGGRVVAVGTTTVRTLESWARSGEAAGDTRIFITPGFAFAHVDLLVTNFHLPKSTLMMLVSAFAGYERVMALYAHAIRENYRFFSYGDAMLLERTTC